MPWLYPQQAVSGTAQRGTAQGQGADWGESERSSSLAQGSVSDDRAGNARWRSHDTYAVGGDFDLDGNSSGLSSAETGSWRGPLPSTRNRYLRPFVCKLGAHAALGVGLVRGLQFCRQCKTQFVCGYVWNATGDALDKTRQRIVWSNTLCAAVEDTAIILKLASEPAMLECHSLRGHHDHDGVL
jgi:hypothetical protein